MNMHILIAALVAAVIFAAMCAIGWHNAAKAAEQWRDTARAAVSEREDEMQRAETFQRRLLDVEPREALFRHALGFYAKDTNWRPMRTRRHSITFRDRGAVARAALRGEDVDQVMQQLQLTVVKTETVAAAPDTTAQGQEVAATSEPEQAAA